MIFPLKMRKITAILLKEYGDDMAKSLLDIGVIDFINPENMETKDNLKSLELLKDRIDIFLNMIPGNKDSKNLSMEDLTIIDSPMVIKFLDTLNDKLKHIRKEQKQIQEKILSLEEIERQTKLIPGDIPSDASSDIEELRQNQLILNDKTLETVESHKDELLKISRELKTNIIYIQIQTSFVQTDSTFIFSGWIPEINIKKLENRLNDITSNNYYLKLSDEIEDIPVELSSPGILNPFKKIVENYSLPDYGTIDPTIFTAFTYMIMFGLMFADAGHGFVILTIGLLGIKFIKGKYNHIYQLMIWCGFSAIIFGILFGSYFGMKWFNPIWFDYHGIISGESHGDSEINTIFGVLGVTVYFGIFVIYLGLVMNWVNLFIQKRWIRLFFAKEGILGGWIYGAGIYTARFFIINDYKSLPDPVLLFFIIMLPTLLLFVKAPLESRDEKFSASLITDFIMDGIVQVLEMFTGYLSNTLSFMRIAGLGIAHISLMIAFFQIAQSVNNTFISIIILILGNALVITLEGLSAGIQSLRLNYYEFYSKYFNGKGRGFNPLSLGYIKKKESI
ncbi:MAG: hypothetical protein OCD02_16480 [Spirochaetaceae bacterium]